MSSTVSSAPVTLGCSSSSPGSPVRVRRQGRAVTRLASSTTALRAIANSHTRRLAIEESNESARRQAFRNTSCTTSCAAPSSPSWRSANRYSSGPCAA
jgi:hypothetical protein